MIYVTLKNLRAGMIIGRSVTYGDSQIPLLVPDQQLTLSMIRRIEDKDLTGVYIKSSFFNDIGAESYLAADVKSELTGEIKSIYKNFLEKKIYFGNVEKEIRELAESLVSNILSKNDCYLNEIEIKNHENYTYSHSLNTAILSVLIGIKLGFHTSSLKELALAGLLHDIGMLDVSFDIRDKPILTDEVSNEMKKHPEYAVTMLKYFPQPEVLSAIRSHHEKYDGTGYPHGLAGDKIPLYGRILAIADVYDAVTSAKSYRRAWYPHEAIEYMMDKAKAYFDYDIFCLFLKTVSSYPIGTIVELSNDYIGLVIETLSEQNLRPVVRIIMPEEQRGIVCNLSSDLDYLSVSVVGIITDLTIIPDELFK